MRVIGGRTAAWALCVAVLAIAVGCGSESDGADGSTGLDSEPARLVQEVVQTSAAAKNAKDCKEVAKVNLRSRTKVVCPPLTKEMRQVSKGTSLLRAATYRSAAVVDYRSPGAKDGASIVLYRNAKGQWILGRWGLSYGATVGTDDGDARDETRAIVDRYLAAVRDRDCAAYAKYAATQAAEQDVVCKTEFPVTRDLAKALDGAEPSIRYLGGNEDLAFYEVATPAGRYTVSTVATPKGSLRPFVVLDAVPGPSA